VAAYQSGILPDPIEAPIRQIFERVENFVNEKAEVIEEKINPPNDFSLEKIEKKSLELTYDLKFEKADIVRALNYIMKDEKLPDALVSDWYSTLINTDERISDSEEAGLKAVVLTLASTTESNKNLVNPIMLKQPIINSITYDDTKYFLQEPNTTYGGQPWYYLAGKLFQKHYPNMVEYTEPETKVIKKGIFGSNIGAQKETTYSLGYLLNLRDEDYSENILAADGDWFRLASDHDWFGPTAVGYVIGGGLDNVKNATPEECANYINKYFTQENYERFWTDKEFHNKIKNCYIRLNMEEAIRDNSGTLGSGMSAYAFQEAGMITGEHLNIIKDQLIKEFSSDFTLFDGFKEAKKTDVAIKAFVLAKSSKYDQIPPETRSNIRRYQTKYPDTVASAIFKLAEDHYHQQFDVYAEQHKQLQELYQNAMEQYSESHFISVSESLLVVDDMLLKHIENEIKVEQEADPKGDRLVELKKTRTSLQKEIVQISENLKKLGPGGAELVDNDKINEYKEQLKVLGYEEF